jgi:glycosyltransferase involved in cell wall biosynthesis
VGVRAHRVLICSNIYPPHFVGGAELIAHEYAKVLARQGHEVLVFAGDTRSHLPRHTAWRDSYDGVPVVRVRLEPEDFGAEFVNFSHPDLDRFFAELIGEFRPTVVHCHNLTGLTVGVLQRAKAGGISTVVTLHDYWGFCHRNTLMKRSGQLCRDYRRCAECLAVVSDGADRELPIRLRNDFVAAALGEADLLVSPSQYLAERYIEAGFPMERIRVIPYGIDVARFAAVPRRTVSSRLRFAFIGHFGAHKGLSTLMDALTRLNGMRERFELALVGEGELVDAIRQQVRDHRWESVVLLPGKVDNVQIETVYGQTDVLVLPSIWPENHPVSIAEAMASGIPVIASRVGGIPEMVDHGDTGFLVDAGDAVQLAATMETLIENPGLVSELGAKAAQRVANNSFERRVAEYVTQYGARRPACRPGREKRAIVVCVGKRFGRPCAVALDTLALDGTQPRFVMREWVDDGLLHDAAVIWVVDEAIDVVDVLDVARAGIPLLVPTGRSGLRRLCVEGNCGLYYGDADEAVACLEFLMRNRDAREALGRNAAAHVTRVYDSRPAKGPRRRRSRSLWEAPALAKRWGILGRGWGSHGGNASHD